jgi:hypothetical protein
MVDAILVQHFGYKRAPGRPQKGGQNGAKPHDGGRAVIAIGKRYSRTSSPDANCTIRSPSWPPR